MNHARVQPTGSPDIILVGFEHMSSRFWGLVLNFLGVTPVIEGIEPIALPEYYLVGVSLVRCRLYSECRFLDTDFRSCADYLGRSCFGWLQ